MKCKATFLIIGLMFFMAFHVEQGFSQSNACQIHTVCVHPGDMLEYSIILNSANNSQTYNFGNTIDSSHIQVIEQNHGENGTIQNNTIILNLKTGFAYSGQNNAINPFLEILPSPMNYNKSDSSITPIVTEFNGFKRTALVVLDSKENMTSKMEYDMETGILLDAQSTAIITVDNKPELVDFSNKLTKTNIINSSSTGISTLENSILIPNWIKNTSQMWSQGKIHDADFIKALQYLISKGVIQIPHGTSGTNTSQSIPSWIKQSTGLWVAGQISDDEFVKSIQWLIANGIIQVNIPG